MDEVVEATGGRRVEYEALSEAPLREAARIAFGRDEVPTFDFAAADFIVSFGADFLETWLSPVEHARGFARSSGVDDGTREKARFVFLGPRLSLTGQNADDWYPIRPGSEGVVALALASALAQRGGDAGPFAELLRSYDLQGAASQAGVPVETLQELADQLASANAPLILGPGVAGHHVNATASNLAALVLNGVAGAVGTTVHFAHPDLAAPSSSYQDLADAIGEMAAGTLQAVVIHGTNPAYSLPEGTGFRSALGNVGFKVAITPQMDETAALADLILPDRHYLETWGDSNPRPGIWTVQQPVMQPVPHFDSRPCGDLLLGLARRLGHDAGAETFYDYLRNRWSDLHAAAGAPGGTFQEFWREVLRTGMAEFPAEALAEAVLQAPDRALTFDAPTLEGKRRRPGPGGLSLAPLR
jgi:anaerobic selenocysteine-containing dehydrogenase